VLDGVTFRFVFLTLLLPLLACSGSIGGDPAGARGERAGEIGSADASGGGGSGGGGDGAGTDAAPGAFSCDPEATLENLRFRRLTRRQYENTLQDVLRYALDEEAEAAAVMDAARGPLDAVPVDERFRSAEDLHGSYRRLDQAVAQVHVETWYRVATSVADLLTEPGRRARVFGDCATDGDPANDSACLRGFVESFGARVLRRPLDADEVDFYVGFYGGAPGEDPAGLADVVAGLLNAPQFLYAVEHGDDQAPVSETQGPETYRLSAFELASRLSYHFWDSMPDEELWQAAASGELLDDAVYEAQVDRLFEDPRTRATIREFHRDWLKLEDLPELDQAVGFALFEAFAGDDLPGPDLREHMIDDALDLLEHHTWTTASDLATVLQSDLAFPRTDDLASIYGLPVWDGSGEPPSFAPGERPGLLTRAAFLATGSANTRPIMKGVFIRRNMLCDAIPPPPDNAAANPPELSDTLSTREVVEALTEQEGSVCSTCHSTVINPLGFATEGFDALGRVRDVQPLYDDEGQEIGTAELDTSTVPRVDSGDDTPSQGPEDLMRLIVDSGKADACMARHYFRFSFGRFEDVRRDGCVLETLRSALAEGGSMREMLRTVALTEEFRTRSFFEEEESP
jgi:hypothetical protein